MKKICILLFLLLSVNAFSQIPELPKKCTAFKPAVLSNSLLSRSALDKLASSKDYGQAANQAEKNFWTVYSDRDENPVYTAPGSTTKCGTLSFNERVTIAKIEQGYALVYSDPKIQEKWPNVSSQAKCRGWVPMSKLLLWSHCPVNSKKIYEKAMLCANLDEKINNGNLGKLFLNPSNTQKYGTLSINFNYYFVMKHEGNMALLAHQNTLEGNSDRVLYGWVDENSFVAWNQRSCLEPTWDIEDVEFFAKNGTKVNIYEDENMSKKASYISFTKIDSKDYDPYMYRMNGSTLRYPILDHSTSNAWNCSTFSSTGKGGAINAGTTETKKEDSIFKVNLEQLSKIKIAIVIDGTKSMEKYYPAVRDAIKEFNSYFKKSDKVQVGVLIFRDKMDGEFATEIFPMTDPNNPALAKFLTDGGKYGVKSSPKDKTLEEALFYGIDKALDSFGFNPNESNMMFVVGDCGNAKNDYPEISAESIMQKLADKQVTLMGFQVRNESGVGAFNVFNNEICSLIKGGLESRFHALAAQNKAAAEVKVKAQLKKNAYEFTNTAASIENSLYIGSHKYVQSGTLDAAVLKDQMESAVASVNMTVEHQKEIIVDRANGVTSSTLSNSFGGNSEVSGPVLDEAWLASRIGKEYAESFKKTNTTISFKGYTLKKDKASDRDYYKTVIFISEQELNSLIISLKDLYDVAQRKDNDREPYVKAMKALVKSMIPNITDAEMNSKGIDEIMGLVQGLNASTMLTRGKTIAQVASTQAVNAVEYQNILAKFKRQYQKIQTIKKNPYKFVRDFNGAKYYWIPTEDLP